MADCCSGRIHDPPFNCYGIEALSHLRESAYNLHHELAFYLLNNNGRRRKKPYAHLSKDIEKGIVIELTHDLRTDVIFFKPVIECPPQSCVFTWQEHGSTIQ